MTTHISSLLNGALFLALLLALTWLSNRIARHAVNQVLFREMQRIANLLPSLGVYVLADSLFIDSGLPMWLRVLLDLALTLFTISVPFKGETAWYHRETPQATPARLLPRPPFYC